jgi:hypothetical protein
LVYESPGGNIPRSVSTSFCNGRQQPGKPTTTAPVQLPVVSRESLAGEYSANQINIVAHLLLQPDGHFKYELAYDALDETAEGTWDVQGGSVFLTTVPTVNPPRFAFEGDQLNPYGILNIRLDNFPIMKGAS